MDNIAFIEFPYIGKFIRCGKDLLPTIAALRDAQSTRVETAYRRDVEGYDVLKVNNVADEWLIWEWCQDIIKDQTP